MPSVIPKKLRPNKVASPLPTRKPLADTEGFSFYETVESKKGQNLADGDGDG